MMLETIKYTCSCCGKEHEEWPALTYIAPSNYDKLSEEDKQRIGELDSDFCIIRHEDQTDRFIRCTLTQKVIDHCEDLDYGLWVSLSEKVSRITLKISTMSITKLNILAGFRMI